MKRRDFLKLAAGSAALSLLPREWALAASDDWQAAFRAALAEKPWLLGWLGVDQPLLETEALAIEGVWPRELSGSFYRNGPARHEVGAMRYRHWFDPDGMVHRYAIADGRVAHRGRMVATQKYQAEMAGGPLRQSYGTAPPGAPPVSSADSVNVANISVLSHAGRLFALWEGGSPYELDPLTLETLGPVTWSPETQGLPFTAHPRREPDGTLWAIGYALTAGMLVIYQIGADGKLVRALPLRLGTVPMVHDFVVTRRHLVIVLPPYFAEFGSAATLGDSYVWRGQQPARVLVVDKADLTLSRTLEMDAHFTFHYSNAWEDEGGTIHLDHARYPDATIVSDTFRGVERGEWRGRFAAHQRMTIPLTGAIRDESLLDPGLSCEFPQIDRRRTGIRHRRVALLLRDEGASSNHPYLNTLARVDVESGKLERYAFGPNLLPEEHVFVPRGGEDEDDGWLIGTCLDFRRGVTQLGVFDAKRVAEGPLAVARLPYAIPLGFHGTFVRS